MLTTLSQDTCAESFQLVSACDERIIAQLMSDKKRDKVHPVPETIDGFIDSRIGTTRDTHQTWVRLNDDGEVTAALYSARFDKPIANSTDLCGDVASILSTPSCHLDGSSPQSIIFYSISSFGGGEGVKLITQIHDHFNNAGLYAQPPKLATLSPLRAPAHPKLVKEKTNFVDWLKTRHTNVDNLRDDKERLKTEALSYLAQNIHCVQKFHMGNGAEISDINFGANADGTADDTFGMNMMVNYGYPDRTTLVENKDMYARDQLKISKHLVRVAQRSCGNGHRFVA